MKRVLGNRGYSLMSAVALAREFRVNGKRVLATSKPELRTDINWGNSSCNGARFNGNIITNKLEQLRILNAAEIPSLTVYTNPSEVEFPVFCRQRYHQAGNDIVIATCIEEIPARTFFMTKAEKFSGELRIHVFNTGEELAIRAFKKVPQEEEGEYPIRNLEHGCTFKLVTVSEELNAFLGIVLETLHMDFCCVDIGRNPGKQYTVIEVNSAPSLVNNRNTLYWYMNNFGAILYRNWEMRLDESNRTS